MLKLRQLRRSVAQCKDRDSHRFRLTTVPNLVPLRGRDSGFDGLAHARKSSAGVTRNERRGTSEARFSRPPRDLLVNALQNIALDSEWLQDADAKTASPGPPPLPSAHTGERLVNAVTGLNDLIDAEFGQMWASPSNDAPLEDQLQSEPSANESFASEPFPEVSASTSANDDDRRQLPRRDSGCIVKVCRCGDAIPLNSVTWKWRLHGSRLKGALNDVSLKGISFTLDEPLAADERVLLQIKNLRRNESIECAARVIRTIQAEAGWKAVCQFTNPLSLDTLYRVARHVSTGGYV